MIWAPQKKEWAPAEAAQRRQEQPPPQAKPRGILYPKGGGFEARRQKMGDVDGKGSKACFGWYGDAPVRDIPRHKEAAPWKKQSYDDAAAVREKRGGFALKSKGYWPNEGGMVGVVKEWNGNAYGPERVPMRARPAYGTKWDVVVGDAIACEGFVRGVPRRADKAPVAPWDRKGAKDDGPWLREGYKGRQGPRCHGVLDQS